MFGDLGVPVVEKLEALRQHELSGMPDNVGHSGARR